MNVAHDSLKHLAQGIKGLCGWRSHCPSGFLFRALDAGGNTNPAAIEGFLSNSMKFLLASLFLVRPGAPSSVRSLLVAMPFVPSSEPISKLC